VKAGSAAEEATRYSGSMYCSEMATQALALLVASFESLLSLIRLDLANQSDHSPGQ